MHWLCLLKFWINKRSTRSNLWTAQLPWPSQGPAGREHGEDDADEEVEEENDIDDYGEKVQNYEDADE